MSKLLIWFTKKYLNGRYWKNPLCSLKFYRQIRGGEWIFIDHYWLRINKKGYLNDVQGRIYTYSIPQSCIRKKYILE